ncbi:Rossmann-like and DUF2520 domain-containing protein [Pseudochryseolinea flava]|uniref:DUF2520 domain-containing protein n=1 Tax=Pseudochryseolinea flava TaxID=2059302 RepID=A0A364Y793_9BACT|nr:Rossmann-like and DUF2520 domain-containing protein [Pseudochryseolinea flava]RAW02763.1 DUF2520 domain-containing protein [Pseudochryseolinea flava]
MKSTTVSFIGAGNVAWHLAPALDNTEFAVREVYSRNEKHAAAIVDKLYEAEVNPTLDFSESTSKIFIIAVADDAIQDVVRDLKLPHDAILVHTSGSQPLSALGYAPTTKVGVFYPLQTFTKGKLIDFQHVPFFVESEDVDTEKILLAMGKAISKKVLKISSDDRKALHVAAVFASNFTNHMFTIAENIMEHHRLSFDLLKPLIAETLNKGLEIGPQKAQTGPARRGDLEILDRHMEFLNEDEEVSDIYKVVSQHIVNTYHQ